MGTVPIARKPAHPNGLAANACENDPPEEGGRSTTFVEPNSVLDAEAFIPHRCSPALPARVARACAAIPAMATIARRPCFTSATRCSWNATGSFARPRGSNSCPPGYVTSGEGDAPSGANQYRVFPQHESFCCVTFCTRNSPNTAHQPAGIWTAGTCRVIFGTALCSKRHPTAEAQWCPVLHKARKSKAASVLWQTNPQKFSQLVHKERLHTGDSCMCSYNTHDTHTGVYTL